MCFSFESSIKSWIYALLACILLLLISSCNQLAVWISVFTLTFTQIQIIEAMIWRDINNGKNSDLVKYIPVLLWFQPLIQCLFGFSYSKNYLLLGLSFVYMTIILKELYSKDTFSATISEDHHIIWNRYNINNKPIFILGDSDLYILIYLLGMFIPLLFIKNNITKYVLLGYGIGSILYTGYFYKQDEFNSLWCYNAVNYVTLGIILYVTGQLY